MNESGAMFLHSAQADLFSFGNKETMTGDE